MCLAIGLDREPVPVRNLRVVGGKHSRTETVTVRSSVSVAVLAGPMMLVVKMEADELAVEARPSFNAI